MKTNTLFRKTKKTFSSLIILALIISTLNIFYIDSIQASDSLVNPEDNPTEELEEGKAAEPPTSENLIPEIVEDESPEVEEVEVEEETADIPASEEVIPETVEDESPEVEEIEEEESTEENIEEELVKDDDNNEENPEILPFTIPFEILDIPEISLNTNINTVNPYEITSSPLTITANGDSELDNMTLLYRYSIDNNIWIEEKNKTIGEVRKLTNIDNTWITLNFLNSYHSPVVVCSYNLLSNSDNPAVVRVSNVTSKNCDIRIQNPGDLASVTAGDIHIIIIEEGAHNLSDGRKIEAHKYKESITAENSNWDVGTSQTYSHTYTNPVVIGQVMSQNDSRWSVFWCSNGNRANPPSSTALYTSKHVGEDTDISRNEEMIGYIVIESGSGNVNSINYETSLGSDSVGGVGTSPPYSYSLGDSYSVGVATHNAMDGGDGGWCVIYGNNPISSNLNIAIDEDMIGGSERSHTTEQVAYFLFSDEGIITSNETSNWIKWDNPIQNPDSITPWSWNFDFPNNIGYYEFCSMGMSNDNVEKLPDISDTKCFYDIPPLDTSINEIIPYTVLSSPVIIDATNSGRDPENVTLYYRYSNDNVNWDTDSSWWDNSFSRRKAISLSVPSGVTPENFTVLLNISYDSDMQSDFDDLRFISINDDVELDYWIEEKVDGSWCNVWVEIRDNITTTSQSLAWMYYGNSIVGNNSNGADAFLFFDDFSSQSYFDNYWTYPITAGSGATYTISDGYLTINGGSAPNIATSPDIGLNDYSIDFKFYFIGSLGGAGGGVLRYNSGDWYEQELDENSLDMYRFTSINSYTNLASTPSTHQAETWYDINFKIGGDQLSAHMKQLNRTISATDSNYATGVPGLYRWNRDCRFDDYRVRKYAIEEPTYILGSEEDNQGWIKWNNANNPDISNPWNWNFNFPDNSGYYEFYSIAKEGGEVENTPSVADTSCYYPPIETIVEHINPYLISDSIYTIGSMSTGATPENVTLYYRYSNDNVNWDTDSSWWDNSFSRRKAISLSVPSGVTPENFTVLLNISYDSDMQSDFDDLRFISINDDVDLDYWIEEKVDGSWCNVWVELRDNITTTSQSLAWMYYGNSIVGNISDGAETFELFDDFSGSTLDSKWQINANDYSVSNGLLRINIGAITLSDELSYNLNDGYTLEGKILYHTTLGGYSGSLSGQSSQYTRSSNSGSDATNLYMRSGSSVRRWTGTGSTTGYNCGSSVVFLSSDNIWYILGAEFNSIGVNLTENREQQGSYGCGWSKDITYISLGAFHGPASYNIQDTSYDWVLIRKQVASEPDYDIGVEETKHIGWNLWNNPLNPDTNNPWSWNFNFPNSSGFYEFYSIGSNNRGIEEIPNIADAKCQYMKDSSVYPISPYEITSSPINISAFPSFIFDNVSLWYRYADDNNTWGTYPTWWDNNWTYYRKITIDHNKIDDDLVNFPVLVKINSTIAEKCDNGESIRFIGADNTTELYYEIAEWNNNADSFIWVNITDISSTSDTTFLMYYNNSDAVDNQNPENVWDSNFKLIQHLDETSGTHYDSTIYDNDCSPQNGVDQNSDGIINGADNFDGSDDYLLGPSSNQITGDYLQTITFSTWVKHSLSDDNGIISSLKKSATPNTLISLDAGNSGAGNLGFITRNSINTEDVSLNHDGGYNDGEWHHLVGVVNEQTRILYVDGVNRNSDTQGMQNVRNNDAEFTIGSFYTPGYGEMFNGFIDEVRVSNIARTSAWINASYQNQKDVLSFLTINDEIKNKENINWTFYQTDNNGDEGWNWSFSFPNDTGYYEFYSISRESNKPEESPPSSADAICYYNPSTGPVNYSLTINIEGNGSTSPASGIHSFVEGSIIQINASADPGWEFDHWSGDASGGNNSVNVTIDGDKTITANFTQIPIYYNLTINVIGNGFTNPVAGVSPYLINTIVTVNASANPGWSFSSWSGDIFDSSSSINITMDSNKTIFALFTLDCYNLNIIIEGNGSVSKDPNFGCYLYGSIVELEASADPGWIFNNWSGDLSGSNDSINITMDDDKTVIANFSEIIDIEKPSNISGLTVTDARNQKLDVSWDTATDNTGIDHYEVYRDGNFSRNTTSNSFQDTGLINDQSYSYQIRAVDFSGNIGNLSNSESGTPTEYIPPNPGPGPGPVFVPSSDPVPNTPPTANAGGPYTGYSNEKIIFDASASKDQESNNIKYRWDFNNDGEYDTEWLEEATTEHVYTSPAEYTIKLQVKDPYGETDTNITYATITIRENHPPANLTIIGPNTGRKNEEYTYSAKATDKDDDLLKYVFNWSDGSNDTIIENIKSNNSINATHTWKTYGQYEIIVICEDEKGAQISKSITVFIDVILIDDVIKGQLIDENSNGIYDLFYNYENANLTPVEKLEDNSYLINSDEDEQWDYQYNIGTKELSQYIIDADQLEPEGKEGTINLSIYGIISMIIVLTLFLLLFFFYKNNKEDQEEPKQTNDENNGIDKKIEMEKIREEIIPKIDELKLKTYKTNQKDPVYRWKEQMRFEKVSTQILTNNNSKKTNNIQKKPRNIVKKSNVNNKKQNISTKNTKKPNPLKKTKTTTKKTTKKPKSTTKKK